MIKYIIGKDKRLFDKKLLITFSIFLFVFQLILIYEAGYQCGWDPQAVHNGAHALTYLEPEWLKGASEYFSYHPNNLFITIIYSWLYKLNRNLGLPISIQWLWPLVLQSVISVLTGVLTYKCALQLMSRKLSWIVYALYIIFVGISPWLLVAYSDSTALFIPILELWIYIRIKKLEKKSIIWIILLGIVSGLGYRLKPYALIVIIAILIVEALYKLKNMSSFNIVHFGTFLVSILATVLLIGALNNNTKIDINEESAFGMTHYVMIGLSEPNGGWNQEDDTFSENMPTRKERTYGNIEVIKQRLSNMGVGGLVKKWGKKIVYSHNDGMFGYSKSDYRYVPEVRDNILGNRLRKLFYGPRYAPSEWYDIMAWIKETIWIIVLIFDCLGLICIIKNHKNYVIGLSIVGMVMYMMFFESHPRYVYICVPMYIILAGLGMDGIFKIKQKDFLS